MIITDDFLYYLLSDRPCREEAEDALLEFAEAQLDPSLDTQATEAAFIAACADLETLLDTSGLE